MDELCRSNQALEPNVMALQEGHHEYFQLEKYIAYPLPPASLKRDSGHSSTINFQTNINGEV